MRRFLLFAPVCTLFVLAGLSYAQQLDIAVGGSTLFSPKPTSASLAYPPPAENGGNYPSASFQYLFERYKNRIGFNAELAYRYHKGLYNGYQFFRPVLYDVNAVFAPNVGAKTDADLMAGVGGESLIFYNQFGGCSPGFAGNCPALVNSNHFLVHLGGDLRYYVWRNFFVRPEAHYYFIRNNFEFHSDNLFRAGASIGYTFGSR